MGGGGGSEKNNVFGDTKIFVDNFSGSTLNWTIFEGDFYRQLSFLASFLCHGTEKECFRVCLSVKYVRTCILNSNMIFIVRKATCLLL